MRKKYCLFILMVFFTFLFQSSWGQDQKELKYEDLYKRILDSGKNKKLAFSYVQKYLKKAKDEKNIDELFTGYSLAPLYVNNNEKEKYADSLITVAIQTKDDRYIGLAYSNSSSLFFSTNNYSRSLENSLIAYDYLKNDNSSKEYINSVKSLIGNIKFLLMDYEDSKKILDDVVIYFRWKKDNVKTFSNRNEYIFSLMALIKVNAVLKRVQENKNLIKEGYSFLSENRDMILYKPGFISVDAFNDYSQGHFVNAQQKLTAALKLHNDTETHFYEKYYIGMSYWKLKQDEKALPFFQEIIDNYKKTEKISLEFRPAFEFFIEYYKKNGNREKLLNAVDELLGYEKKFKADQANITQKLKTDYDEKRLLEEKEDLLSDQKKERWSFISIGILGIISATGFFMYQNKKNKKIHSSLQTNVLKELENIEYSNSNTQNKNEEIPRIQSNFITEKKESNGPLETPSEEEISIVYSSQNQQKNNTSEIDYEAYLPINKFTVKQLLKSLDDFEKSNKYLASDLRLNTLAERFNTNDKYLSRIIKVKTGKTFNNYINDLRFKHLESLLKSDLDFKERKIKEIAKYLGFGTPEFFATAFKERFGKTPREYFETA
ncbi:helix-turn-helix domain-containing protein [Chryseobacterium taiwanense]|uniref:HTH araC/xylS-type domain-containing protein n=1 Tax=Chryseobacterium taiwanense TaxID=363331 RepID=A0A0B4D5B2_9FLAO|nr:AraC family transcriptional regulator [Chryseobacterium taiwanense]KIC61861.1 hypothetical protein RM51_15955 [Chryseobacterium taiwanense]